MIRSATFLKSYRALPHFLVNGVAGHIAKQERPAWLVGAAVRSWVKRDRIDMTDFEHGPFDSLEHFFLRKLAPGKRPLGQGLISPVDGCVVGLGTITAQSILQVKGVPLSVSRLVNGNGIYDLPLDEYEGGRWVTLFLRPRGYHYVHAPFDGALLDVRSLSGRFFPQNEDALVHIPRIYERNERAVLRMQVPGMLAPILLVMVGASVVGGIHVYGTTLRTNSASKGTRTFRKGEAMGHFSFGSTVVLLLPRASADVCAVALGDELKMGQTLFGEFAQ